MCLLKKWPHRLLLLPKLKSDSGSGSGFSQIFDPWSWSGSERRRQNPAGVDSSTPDPVPPLVQTTRLAASFELLNGLVALTRPEKFLHKAIRCFFLENLRKRPDVEVLNIFCYEVAVVWLINSAIYPSRVVLGESVVTALTERRAVFPAFSSREVSLGHMCKIGIHFIIYIFNHNAIKGLSYQV